MTTKEEFTAKDAYLRWRQVNNQFSKRDLEEVRKKQIKESRKSKDRFVCGLSFLPIEAIDSPILDKEFMSYTPDERLRADNEAIKRMYMGGKHYQHFKHCSGLRVILHYKNRKLYDCISSSYVNAVHVEIMINKGWRVRMVSWPDKTDLTKQFLMRHWARLLSDAAVEKDQDYEIIYSAIRKLPETIKNLGF